MQPYQQRVIEERAALNEKWEALGRFKVGGEFRRLPVAEQEALRTQHDVMCLYLSILDRRIQRFKG